MPRIYNKLQIKYMYDSFMKQASKQAWNWQYYSINLNVLSPSWIINTPISKGLLYYFFLNSFNSLHKKTSKCIVPNYRKLPSPGRPIVSSDYPAAAWAWASLLISYYKLSTKVFILRNNSPVPQLAVKKSRYFELRKKDSRIANV